MAVKRTVTKSKKDGVKKKKVTTSTRRGSVTRTKAKGKKEKAKTTTVTAKKRTNSGFKDKVIATSSKQKSRAKRDNYTEKQKNVLLSDGRMASSKKEKGSGSWLGNKDTRRSLKGAVGARTSSMSKVKWSKGKKTKGRSSGTGEANMYMTSRGVRGTDGVSQDDSRRYGTGKDSSKSKVSRKGLRRRK
jgi:hypothetical protein